MERNEGVFFSSLLHYIRFCELFVNFEGELPIKYNFSLVS